MNGHTNGSNGNEAVPLPSAPPYDATDNIRIQPPLTRRGHGPGLILLVPDMLDLKGSDKTLDPPPLQKWAEEGFAVAQIALADGEGQKLDLHLDDAISALAQLSECDSVDRLGLISYNVSLAQNAVNVVEKCDNISAVISYGQHSRPSSRPQLLHSTGHPSKAATGNASRRKTFQYPDTGPFFTIPSHPHFKSAPASVAHTRCLTFLKPLIGDPYFDLEAIWDEHCKFEFGERAVEKTMGTMVQEPYVNHIPTITGGIGRDNLTNFYRHHFIFNNPDDTALELVSRTVGIDRVIDEFVFSFTHDREMDWLCPGIPPTNQHVKLPFTSVVNIRGDRLFHEHISWDQATCLRQMGLMPEYLPFPYALPDGRKPAEGTRFEYRVPTAGSEITNKLVDETSVQSNGMFEFEVREVAI